MPAPDAPLVPHVPVDHQNQQPQHHVLHRRHLGVGQPGGKGGQHQLAQLPPGHRTDGQGDGGAKGDAGPCQHLLADGDHRHGKDGDGGQHPDGGGVIGPDDVHHRFDDHPAPHTGKGPHRGGSNGDEKIQQPGHISHRRGGRSPAPRSAPGPSCTGGRRRW